ncbi:MAG: carbohydrate kinase [Rhodopirellula sp.]|nr:carbohydrate kinase [Rhodopirellula sp.]OUX51635.1 MAG: carbohydrate kinase [Rhodopirellula sp. TMED283]
MKSIITFGEIMGRLTPPGFVRLGQGLPGTLEVTFAGAEANVAASLAFFGADAKFVTALPHNDLADACIASLQATGMASHIVRTDYGRMGLYFLEKGANQRPSRVIYDRDHSAISLTEPQVYDWSGIFTDGQWFHVTGITPAISSQAAEATVAAVRAAKQAGLTVSCDLNFRAKLWQWEPETSKRDLAKRVMSEVLTSVDVLIANEEDCGDVLGIRGEHADVHSGKLDSASYPEVARQVVADFPNIGIVATTLRESLSASHNNWGAMLYAAQSETAIFSPRRSSDYAPYEIRNIVDRVGGGDSFAAGLIFALTNPDYSSLEEALDFAVAASCLAHSIEGDFNHSSRAEVDALAGGSGSGRVVR